jgi:hypothetical protein
MPGQRGRTSTLPCHAWLVCFCLTLQLPGGWCQAESQNLTSSLVDLHLHCVFRSWPPPSHAAGPQEGRGGESGVGGPPPFHSDSHSILSSSHADPVVGEVDSPNVVVGGEWETTQVSLWPYICDLQSDWLLSKQGRSMIAQAESALPDSGATAVGRPTLAGPFSVARSHMTTDINVFCLCFKGFLKRQVPADMHTRLP